MGKYDSELMKYGKASGAFEYAAKRYAANSANQQLKQEVASTFNHLENEAYKPIEDAYRKDPEDKDAASAYEIAARDLMLMRNKLQTLP